MMKFILILFFAGASVQADTDCIPQGQPCDQTCQCCDHDVDPGRVRCEERNHSMGRRCFSGKFCKEECAHDHECYSQKCGTNSSNRRRLNGPSKMCICEPHEGKKKCDCNSPIESIKLVDKDGVSDATLGKNVEALIDGKWSKDDPYFRCEDDKLCFVELTTKDKINVCAIRLIKYDNERPPEQIHVDGWCEDEKHPKKGYWKRITLLGIDVNPFDLEFPKDSDKLKILVRSPKAEGPYNKFRIYFYHELVGVSRGRIHISEIQILHDCLKEK